MAPKLRKTIEAGLAAGSAIAREVADPTRNWGEMGTFAAEQNKIIKSAIRALAKLDETT